MKMRLLYISGTVISVKYYPIFKLFWWIIVLFFVKKYNKVV